MQRAIIILIYSLIFLNGTALASENSLCKTEPVFVKLGQHTFKLPAGQFISIYTDKQSKFSDCWISNKDKPIEAYKIEFPILLDIDGYDTLKYTLKIFKTNKPSWRVTWLLDEMDRQKTKIENLPTLDGFYVYQRPNSMVATYYKKLGDGKFDYMVLSLCRNSEQAFSCSASYNWKKNITIVMGLNASQITAPMSVQLSLRDAVINKMNELLYLSELEK